MKQCDRTSWMVKQQDDLGIGPQRSNVSEYSKGGQGVAHRDASTVAGRKKTVTIAPEAINMMFEAKEKDIKTFYSKVKNYIETS